MSECEQGKQGPEAVITRKPKSMKISWVQILGRENFFICIHSFLCMHICLWDLILHLCRRPQYFLASMLQAEIVTETMALKGDFGCPARTSHDAVHNAVATA